MSSNINFNDLVENKLFLDKLARDEYFVDKLINNKYYVDRLRDVLNFKTIEKKLYYDYNKFITTHLEYTKLNRFQACYLMERNNFDDYIEIIIPNTIKIINFGAYYFSGLIKENNIEQKDNVRKFINYLNSNEITILNIFEFSDRCGYLQSSANRLLTDYCDDINDLNNILKLIPKYLGVCCPSNIETYMEKEKEYDVDKKLEMFAKIRKIYDGEYVMTVKNNE